MTRAHACASPSALIASLLVGGSTAYVLASRSDQQQRSRPRHRSAPCARQSSPTGPRIVFRNTAIGADYGEVAMVPLAAPQGLEPSATLSATASSPVDATRCASPPTAASSRPTPATVHEQRDAAPTRSR